MSAQNNQDIRYTDEELMEFDLSEVGELNQAEINRLNALREEKLKDSARENINEWKERDDSKIDDLVKASKGMLTTTIEIEGDGYSFDIEAYLKLDREERQLMREMEKYDVDDESDLADMSEEEITDAQDKMIELLSSICRNMDKSDWKTYADQVGFYPLNYVGGIIMRTVMKENESKMEGIENFRS